ncbi:MAG: hypothetical protein LUC99_06400 [Clostridiales bacterium]|nr:hypothetical protein [Clostridiales bacterium]
MKKYKYERYTIRLTKEMAAYVKAVSEHRGIAPTAFIKAVLGEYREVNEYGKSN